MACVILLLPKCICSSNGSMGAREEDRHWVHHGMCCSTHPNYHCQRFAGEAAEWRAFLTQHTKCRRKPEWVNC